MAVKVKGDKVKEPTKAQLDTAVAKERLICVDVDDNNCKFWHGFALANGDGFCEWGRVDKTRQHEYYNFGNVSDAQNWLESKTQEKLNKRGKASYTRQKTIDNTGTVNRTSVGGGSVRSSDLKNIAAQQIKGDSETTKLVTWLAEVNVHQITKNTQITYNVQTGSFSTPLGLVTPDGITEARDILNGICDYVQNRDWNNAKYKKLLSDYLRIIPQNVGMVRGWHETIFAPADSLQKQNDILDSLSASLQAPSTGKKSSAGNVTESVFNVSLETVSDPAIISRIRAKYNSEKGSHYDVKDFDVRKVWTVHITTVRSAFQGDGIKVGGMMQLWHGTKASNVLSILKGGLVIPPASASHVCGRMFGNGLYFSDQSTKSIRYATGAWTGGGNTERVFMFIADVAMGKYYTPQGYQSGSFRVPSGYDSCFAKGGKSGVQNNEMIVYRVSQADLTYLVEFGRNKTGW